MIQEKIPGVLDKNGNIIFVKDSGYINEKLILIRSSYKQMIDTEFDPDSPKYVKRNYFQLLKTTGNVCDVVINNENFIKLIEEYFYDKIKNMKTMNEMKAFLEKQRNNSLDNVLLIFKKCYTNDESNNNSLYGKNIVSSILENIKKRANKIP